MKKFCQVANQLLCATVMLTGCASNLKPKSVAVDPIVMPPVELIVGELVRDSQLFGDVKSTSVLCNLQSGRISIQRFQAGRYFVQLNANARCAAGAVTSGWVSAKDVDYNDNALLPLLKRVIETPNLRIDMAYAGTQIFCEEGRCKINEALYGKGRCYAIPVVADALAKAANALALSDPSARLVVLDCYRPIDVQIEMFKRVADPVWVAQPVPPRYGGHNRGVAIDLTIERNGKLLDMGSAFDAFNDVSNYDPKQVPGAAHANRTLLRELMISNGFRPYDAEW
jgi:D-alanyl-D-alanine dipeptidase